jgi:hypothetical protein
MERRSMNQENDAPKNEPAQNQAVPTPDPAPAPVSEEVVIRTALPYMGPNHAGPKSPLEEHLINNAWAAQKHYETMILVQGKNYQPMTRGEISDIPSLHRYAAFEITRAKNEDMLRGQTFVDYGKLLLQILKAREEAIRADKIAFATIAAILEDRTEMTAFYKAVRELIVQFIPDETLRTQFAKELQKLYDEYYDRQRTTLEQLPADNSGASSEGTKK